MKYLKQAFILFLILSISYSLKAQTISNFARGYKSGFVEGYCYGNQGVDCLSPNPPLTPQPGIYESVTSYQDGFNKGFQVGLDLQRSQSEDKRNPYSPPTPKFNPYYSQVPSGMTVQQYAEARAAKASQQQYIDKEFVEALGALIDGLFSNKNKDDFNEKSYHTKSKRNISKVIKKTQSEIKKLDKANLKLKKRISR
jgi:hypothetical protein